MAAEENVLVRLVTARLRELRQANRLTATAVAERVGLPPQNIRRIETGQNVTLKTLARIANALGYDVKVTFVRRRD